MNISAVEIAGLQNESIKSLNPETGNDLVINEFEKLFARMLTESLNFSGMANTGGSKSAMSTINVLLENTFAELMTNSSSGLLQGLLDQDNKQSGDLK